MLSLSGFCLCGFPRCCSVFFFDHDFGGLNSAVHERSVIWSVCGSFPIWSWISALSSSAYCLYLMTAGLLAHLSLWVILGFPSGVIGILQVMVLVFIAASVTGDGVAGDDIFVWR